MLLRLALFIILAFFVARAFWRLLDGIVEGASRGSRGSQVPQRGVQMVRDPVCGTFVVADQAVTLTDGRTQIYFCSNACRDKYRRPSGGSGRAENTAGHSA
jgi:YHS domain-containing protein